MSAIAKKTWLHGGSPMTHGEFMTNVARADSAKAGAVMRADVPNGDCPGQLEQRGYREINDANATYVEWFGSYDHVMLFCPFCNPDMGSPDYVTSVPRRPGEVEGATSTPTADLW